MANMKKCDEILTWWKVKNHDIIFLQEMHCCKSKKKEWHKLWGNGIVFCRGTTNKEVQLYFQNVFIVRN